MCDTRLWFVWLSLTKTVAGDAKNVLSWVSLFRCGNHDLTVTFCDKRVGRFFLQEFSSFTRLYIACSLFMCVAASTFFFSCVRGQVLVLEAFFFVVYLSVNFLIRAYLLQSDSQRHYYARYNWDRLGGLFHVWIIFIWREPSPNWAEFYRHLPFRSCHDATRYHVSFPFYNLNQTLCSGSSSIIEVRTSCFLSSLIRWRALAASEKCRFIWALSHITCSSVTLTRRRPRRRRRRRHCCCVSSFIRRWTPVTPAYVITAMWRHWLTWCMILQPNIPRYVCTLFDVYIRIVRDNATM